MRFMVLVKADKNSEAGVLPDEKLLTEMGKFNEELVKAGVMLAGEGLHPSSKGARVRFSGSKRTVIDGPFAETKELIAGFWLWQVKSKEEAIEWVKRCPNPTGASRRSRSARCSRRRTSAPSSRPSFASRRSACARRWRTRSRAAGMWRSGPPGPRVGRLAHRPCTSRRSHLDNQESCPYPWSTFSFPESTWTTPTPTSFKARSTC